MHAKSLDCIPHQVSPTFADQSRILWPRIVRKEWPHTWKVGTFGFENTTLRFSLSYAKVGCRQIPVVGHSIPNFSAVIFICQMCSGVASWLPKLPENDQKMVYKIGERIIQQQILSRELWSDSITGGEYALTDVWFKCLLTRYDVKAYPHDYSIFLYKIIIEQSLRNEIRNHQSADSRSSAFLRSRDVESLPGVMVRILQHEIVGLKLD